MATLPKGRVFHGARALVYMNNRARSDGGPSAPPADTLNLIGIFTDVSWSWGLMDAEIDILGRFSVAAIEYVGASVVSGNASGWRVVNHSVFSDGFIPTLDDLLNWSASNDLVIAIVDRQNTGSKPIVKLSNVKILGYDGGVATKDVSRIRIAFKGLTVEEDGISNTETGIPDLPA